MGCIICGATWLIAFAIVGLIASGLGLHYRENGQVVCDSIVINGFGNFMSLFSVLVPVCVFGVVAVRVRVAILANRCCGSADPVNPVDRI